MSGLSIKKESGVTESGDDMSDVYLTEKLPNDTIEQLAEAKIKDVVMIRLPVDIYQAMLVKEEIMRRRIESLELELQKIKEET